MGHVDSEIAATRKKRGDKLKHTDIWCVIPVYNNSDTVAGIVSGAKRHGVRVLVVDDGSEDADIAGLFSGEPGVFVLSHGENRGKGAALSDAINFLEQKKASHMITIDADGQHNPDDIPKFVEAVREDPNAIWVGARDFDQPSVPSSSRFGRRFSNMWFKIETGMDCMDTQSGFRAYPVRLVSKFRRAGRHYDFEIEILARASWAGLEVKNVPVDVHYPDDGERVSHFKPFRDNLRISLMHARLVGRRLLPLPHGKLIEREPNYKKELLLNPRAFLKMLLAENSTPAGLAVAAAVGTFLAVLPLIGIHTLVILYVAARLHLNKIMALSIQVLYSPPFVPFVCIEVGHYVRTGRFVSDFGLSSVVGNLHLYFLDWLAGSLVMAPIYTIIAFVGVYYISLNIQNKAALKKENAPTVKKAW